MSFFLEPYIIYQCNTIIISDLLLQPITILYYYLNDVRWHCADS